MRKNHETAKWIMLGIVQVLILVGVVIDIGLTLRLSARLDTRQTQLEACPSLPCAAIPTQLVLEDPACAEKLVRAMNVTNVRVVGRESLLLGSSKP